MKKLLVSCSIFLFISCNPLGTDNDIDNSIYCVSNFEGLGSECALYIKNLIALDSISYSDMENGDIIAFTGNNNSVGFFRINIIDKSIANCNIIFDIIMWDQTTGNTIAPITYQINSPPSTTQDLDGIGIDFMNPVQGGICTLVSQVGSAKLLHYRKTQDYDD